MTKIELLKELVSKEAIVSAINQMGMYNSYKIIPNDLFWVLEFSDKDEDLIDSARIRKSIFEIQEHFNVEKMVYPIREMLYRKAFSPIGDADNKL